MKFVWVYFLSFFVIINYEAHSGAIKGTVKTQDGSLADVVVYIEKIEGKSFTPPEKSAVLDQSDLTFVPHVLPILVGTKVVFPNSDATRHNVFSTGKIEKFDLGTYAPGSSKTVIFNKPGIIPLLCHVHPEMSAFIIVLETPYFAVTNEDGNFKINNIPAGKYKFSVWHEWAKSKSQYIEITESKEITVNFFMGE